MRVLPIFVLAIAPFSALGADTAQSVFDSLFAEKIKAAATTNDRADDVTLARTMLGVAKERKDTPELVILLCEASYDLGQRHPDGYPIAADAMTLLMSIESQSRDAAREKLIDVLMKQSRTGSASDRTTASGRLIQTLIAAGDEKLEAKKYEDASSDFRRAVALSNASKSPLLDLAKDRLEDSMRLDRAIKRVAALRERLLADAGDKAAANEIVRLYLLELNDPAGAGDIVERSDDAGLKKIVGLTNKSLTDMANVEALHLGEWYCSEAKALKGNARTAAFAHARTYLKHALEDPSLNTLSRAKAEVLVGEADRELGPASSSSRPPSKFMSLDRFDELFSHIPSLQVKDGVISVRCASFENELAKLKEEVKGKTFRFGLKMKAPSYQAVFASIDGTWFIYSRGHWGNSATAVVANNKATFKIRGAVDAPNDFALIEMEYDGTEIKYFYNGENLHTMKVLENANESKFIVGFKSNNNLVEVKDIYLLIDGKPMFAGKK